MNLLSFLLFLLLLAAIAAQKFCFSPSSRVATVQVIVVPCGITASTSDQERSDLISYCQDAIDCLKEAGYHCRGDFRDNYSPGWKFNHWELKVDIMSQ